MQRGRTGLALALAASLCSSVVLAQPGQPYPSQPPPQPAPYPQQPAPYPQQPPPPGQYPQPYPQQGPYVPAPYAYQPRQPIQLTAEEAELMQQGIISDGEILGGAVLAFFLGFGSGQAVEGRWGDTGWIFTLGEVVSLGVLIAGAVECGNGEDRHIDDPYNNDLCPDGGGGELVAGLVAYLAFHVWEIVDVFTGPSSHNRKVRAVQARMYGYGYPQPYGFYMKPTMDKEGTVAGLSFSF